MLILMAEMSKQVWHAKLWVEKKVMQNFEWLKKFWGGKGGNWIFLRS